MIKAILRALVAVSLIVAFGLVAVEGVKRHEQVECYQWQEDGEIIRGWYSVEWQREQCLSYSINLKN